MVERVLKPRMQEHTELIKDQCSRWFLTSIARFQTNLRDFAGIYLISSVFLAWTCLGLCLISFSAENLFEKKCKYKISEISTAGIGAQTSIWRAPEARMRLGIRAALTLVSKMFFLIHAKCEVKYTQNFPLIFRDDNYFETNLRFFTGAYTTLESRIHFLLLAGHKTRTEGWQPTDFAGACINCRNRIIYQQTLNFKELSAFQPVLEMISRFRSFSERRRDFEGCVQRFRTSSKSHYDPMPFTKPEDPESSETSGLRPHWKKRKYLEYFRQVRVKFERYVNPKNRHFRTTPVAIYLLTELLLVRWVLFFLSGEITQRRIF